MSKNRQRSFTFFAIALVGIATFVAIRIYSVQSQPKYAGKPVSSWYWDSCRARLEWYEAKRDLYLLKSQVVFGHLGDAAIPFLIEHALDERSDSRLVTAIQPLLLEPGCPDSVRFRFLIPGWVRTGTARQEIMHAHPSWQALAPFLEPILQDPRRHTNDLYAAAITLVGHIGSGYDEALPFLVNAVTNTTFPDKRLAIESLRLFGTNAGPALPIVKDLVRSGSPDLNLVELLGIQGRESRDMIPFLLGVLRSDETSEDARYQVALNILRIDPAESAALQFFRVNLGNHRLAATKNFFVNIVTDSQPIPEPILQIMEEHLEKGYGIPDLLILPLAVLKPEKYQSRLFELQRERFDIHLRNCFTLLRQNPKNEQAAEHLSRLIEERSVPPSRVGDVVRGINALGNASPSLTNVVARLEVFSRDKNPLVANEALAALERMDWLGRWESLSEASSVGR